MISRSEAFIYKTHDGNFRGNLGINTEHELPNGKSFYLIEAIDNDKAYLAFIYGDAWCFLNTVTVTDPDLVWLTDELTSLEIEQPRVTKQVSDFKALLDLSKRKRRAIKGKEVARAIDQIFKDK